MGYPGFPLGTAEMNSGGEIVLNYHSILIITPDDPGYDSLKKHLKGLSTSQPIAVPPWPDQPPGEFKGLLAMDADRRLVAYLFGIGAWGGGGKSIIPPGRADYDELLENVSGLEPLEIKPIFEVARD